MAETCAIPDLEQYYAIRDRIKPGDCWSFHGHALLSWAIRFFSRGRNHIAGSVSSPPGQFARKYWVEAAQGWVNSRLVSCRILEYNGEVYWHQLKPELDEYRDAIDSNLWLIVGKKYDIKGLLNNLKILPLIDASALYCSEALQWATLTGGPVTISGEVFNIPPAIPIPRQKALRMVGIQRELMQQVWANQTLRPGEYCLLPIYQPEVRIK